MKNIILSIDQGTTGTTATLVDLKELRFIGKVNEEFPQIFPKPGWVEHDLNSIWESVEKVVSTALNRFSIDPSAIACIGITNQRETVGAFTKDGTPLGNAIVWQDRRTTDFCNKIKSSNQAPDIQNKTGLTIDPYFSGSKINWLLSNNPNVQKALKENNLLFGNIDTFLLYKLTNCQSYKTEASNASRTMLFNIKTGQWDDELLSLFNVNKENLPQVNDSFGEFGKTKGLSFLPDNIPITGILGDQQAALFGQAGINPGDMKCTYGTGAFFLLNIGDKIKSSKSGLLTTVAYKKDGKLIYALEGACYIAGAAVQWVRDNLGIISSSPEIEELASQVQSLDEMEHILFLPFFTGVGSPHWIPEAKAAILGLTRDSSKAHIAKACLDGVAFSIDDLINAAKNDIDASVESLRVDGGMVANNLFLQTQADVCNLDIIRPKVIETTSYGAALAAAIGLGEIDFSNLSKLWAEDKVFKPSKESAFYQRKKESWKVMTSKLYK